MPWSEPWHPMSHCDLVECAQFLPDRLSGRSWFCTLCHQVVALWASSHMQIWLRSVVRTRDVQKSCLSVFDGPYTWAMQGYKFGWDGKKKTLTMVFVYGIPCGYTVFYCLSPRQCWGIYKVQAGWLLYCVWSQFCCLSMSQHQHEQCNQTHWHTHICHCHYRLK